MGTYFIQLHEHPASSIVVINQFAKLCSLDHLTCVIKLLPNNLILHPPNYRITKNASRIMLIEALNFYLDLV